VKAASSQKLIGKHKCRLADFDDVKQRKRQFKRPWTVAEQCGRVNDIFS